jgi:hypothetical protein
MGEIRLLARAVHWLRYFGPIPILLILLPLADFRLNLGPPSPWGTPLVTSVVAFAAMLLVFRSRVSRDWHVVRVRVALGLFLACAGAAGYIALSSSFVGERFFAGEDRRVVLGFSLHPDLKERIQTDIDLQSARLEKARDPASYLESPNLYDRGPENLAPAKTEDEIRQEAVEEVIAQSRDSSAPYTQWSRDVMAFALLALWEMTFAGVAAAIALLAPAPPSER